MLWNDNDVDGCKSIKCDKFRGVWIHLQDILFQAQGFLLNGRGKESCFPKMYFY